MYEIVNFSLLNSKIGQPKIIQIEEPEVNLHPQYQKLIPSILNDISAEFSNTQFLISTHSPFIISAAGKIAEKERLEGKDPSQKVYLIEDGQTRDLFGELGKGNKGYAGGDCINVVNEMLGSDLSDYFGGLCFLAEKSVCAFLAGLKENISFKDKIKSFTFILAKGEDTQRSIEANDLRRQAYSYSGLTENLKLIVDNEAKNAIIFEQYKNDYPNSLILLSRDEIEPLYGQKVINSFLSKVKNLTIDYQDKPDQSHYFKEFCKTNSLEDKLKLPIGKLKVELGEFAGENIEEENFKANFEDLADLIFNQTDF
jgi:hypothetical protein